MKTVIISPFSQKLRNGEPVNPKNFPHWKEVVGLLKKDGVKTIQIGVVGEEDIGADEKHFNLPLSQLKELTLGATTWASVDNFFHHFCAFHKKTGVVVFGKSDPLVYGYPSNVNLLKDRKYLREQQFQIWEVEKCDPQVWVTPTEVFSAVSKLL